MTTDLISVSEVAARLDCSDETIRKAIRKECADGTRDNLRFVPGGLHFNTVYVIYRGIFDRVTSGQAIEQQAPRGMTPLLREVGRTA
jgi:hypothetical protein